MKVKLISWSRGFFTLLVFQCGVQFFSIMEWKPWLTNCLLFSKADDNLGRFKDDKRGKVRVEKWGAKCYLMQKWTRKDEFLISDSGGDNKICFQYKVIILETSKADFVDIAVFYYKQAKCTLSSLWTWQILIMIMRSIQHFFDSQEQLIGITTLGLWFFFFFFGTRNTIPPRRRIYTDTHFCCFGNDWPKAMQANSPARPAGRFMAPSPSLSLIS